MAKIEYVGAKERRQDTVAGTGIVWVGKGDVKEVPDVAVPRLLKHPDIWRIAELAAQKKPQQKTNEQSPTGDSKPEGAGGSEGGEGGDGKGDGEGGAHVILTSEGPLVLDGMDRDTLMALALESGLKPHPNTGAAKLMAALVEAFPVKAE